MKTPQRLLLLYVLAFFISLSLLFINSDLIDASWTAKMFEVLSVSLVLFIIFAILHAIVWLIVKIIKSIKVEKIKKPSGK